MASKRWWGIFLCFITAIVIVTFALIIATFVWTKRWVASECPNCDDWNQCTEDWELMHACFHLPKKNGRPCTSACYWDSTYCQKSECVGSECKGNCQLDEDCPVIEGLEVFCSYDICVYYTNIFIVTVTPAPCCNNPLNQKLCEGVLPVDGPLNDCLEYTSCNVEFLFLSEQEGNGTDTVNNPIINKALQHKPKNLPVNMIGNATNEVSNIASISSLNCFYNFACARANTEGIVL